MRSSGGAYSCTSGMLARAIRHLARHVRAGGLVVFHEHSSTMTPASLVPMPLYERAQQWIWQTVEREGGDIHMGFRPQKALTEAGLSLEDVRAEAIVQTHQPRPMPSEQSFGRYCTGSYESEWPRPKISTSTSGLMRNA